MSKISLEFDWDPKRRAREQSAQKVDLASLRMTKNDCAWLYKAAEGCVKLRVFAHDCAWLHKTAHDCIILHKGSHDHL